MKRIKVSIPGQPDNLSFDQYIGNKENRFKEYEFYINQDIENPDYWFILESMNRSSETCFINPENIIYLNYETSYPKDYFLNKYMQSYMNQFALKYSCYANVDSSYISTVPFLPWLINSKNDFSAYSYNKKDLDYFKNLSSLKKDSLISIICSNKAYTDDHKARLNFTYKIKEHFQNDLDWFGNGVHEINTKWDGISKYKYHIVLENESRNNLISEKLYDSYLGLSYPIYYGAPNVLEYFPKNSLTKIDIMDLSKSINTIENVINQNLYENHIEEILKSKNLVIDKYNFVSRIIEIVEDSKADINKRSNISINNVDYFWKKEVNYKNKIKHQLKRKLRINVTNY
tara:strand:- start:344 stop:1375 length:1032 start_codon:yes stop_codon:yes gene_type:complete